MLGTLAIHGAIALVFWLIEPPDMPIHLLSLVQRQGSEIEIVDVEPPPPPPPPAPDPEPPPPPPTPEPAAEPPPREAPRTRVAAPRVAAAVAPRTDPVQPTDVESGGAPVLKMDNLGPGTTGVAVAPGPRTGGKHGRGGSGGGEGAGVGTGSADAPPPPVSVASIKKRAMPRGEYDYSNDYPAEARRLGIEGTLRVRLVVDAAGKVTQAKLLGKLGHGLDEVALARARKLQFDPAIDSDDQPVSSVVVWTFYFTLPAGT